MYIHIYTNVYVWTKSKTKTNNNAKQKARKTMAQGVVAASRGALKAPGQKSNIEC